MIVTGTIQLHNYDIGYGTGTGSLRNQKHLNNMTHELFSFLILPVRYQSHLCLTAHRATSGTKKLILKY
jgi:hypothetical protein